MGAAEPQTDRELLLQLNGDIKSLTSSVDKLTEVLTVVQEKEIGGINKRLDKLEAKESERNGMYKIIVVLYTLLAGGVAAAVIKWLS